MADGRLRIVNHSRGTLMGSEIAVADTWFGRLRGFLGRRAPRRGQGLLLSPCNAIHTYGMTFAVDVVFLDSEGQVLELAPALKPGRVSKRVAEGRYVLELPVGTIADTETQVGDEVSWTPALTGLGIGGNGRK